MFWFFFNILNGGGGGRAGKKGKLKPLGFWAGGPVLAGAGEKFLPGALVLGGGGGGGGPPRPFGFCGRGRFLLDLCNTGVGRRGGAFFPQNGGEKKKNFGCSRVVFGGGPVSAGGFLGGWGFSLFSGSGFFPGEKKFFFWIFLGFWGFAKNPPGKVFGKIKNLGHKQKKHGPPRPKFAGFWENQRAGKRGGRGEGKGGGPGGAPFFGEKKAGLRGRFSKEISGVQKKTKKKTKKSMGFIVLGESCRVFTAFFFTRKGGGKTWGGGPVEKNKTGGGGKTRVFISYLQKKKRGGPKVGLPEAPQRENFFKGKPKGGGGTQTRGFVGFTPKNQNKNMKKKNRRVPPGGKFTKEKKKFFFLTCKKRGVGPGQKKKKKNQTRIKRKNFLPHPRGDGHFFWQDRPGTQLLRKFLGGKNHFFPGWLWLGTAAGGRICVCVIGGARGEIGDCAPPLLFLRKPRGGATPGEGGAKKSRGGWGGGGGGGGGGGNPLGGRRFFFEKLRKAPPRSIFVVSPTGWGALAKNFSVAGPQKKTLPFQKKKRFSL